MHPVRWLDACGSILAPVRLLLQLLRLPRRLLAVFRPLSTKLGAFGLGYGLFLAGRLLPLAGLDVGLVAVWAGANVVVALAAANSHRARKLAGEKGAYLLCCVLIVTAYLGLALTTAVWGFAFYYLLTAMRGLQGPLMRSRLQSLSERRNRASVLSLHSLVFRLGFVATGPLVGWLADTRGLSSTFFLLSAFFILALGLAGIGFFRANVPDSLT